MPRKTKAKTQSQVEEAAPATIESATFSPDWNYEATTAELEDLVEQLETSNLDLAEAFNCFEKAVERLQACDRFLSEREAQVDVLIEILGDRDRNEVADRNLDSTE